MGLFKKKELPIDKNMTSYKDWEEDFGFLELIMSRKKNITKQYLIRTYSQQLGKDIYLQDADLEKIINNDVTEIFKAIGDNYKDFLIKKYFGSKEQLISFITEDVYVDLTSDAINANSKKVKVKLQSQALDTISSLNNKINPAAKTKEK
jgi:hypothetical protein